MSIRIDAGQNGLPVIGCHHYSFTQNDPFDRVAQVRLVVEPLMSSLDYMQSIRQLAVPKDALAVWYLGQNGFILKDSKGLLVGIDLYLSNSCATTFAHLPFRLDRQLPVFIEPEDLTVDVFIATHSHDDHCDPETLQRLSHRDQMLFVGPFDAMRIFRSNRVPSGRCQLIHPGERIDLGKGAALQGTFALPTDDTDLNHMGVLLSFADGITFYNTGDTAEASGLADLLPHDIDICAICINGGFHNLSAVQAAGIIARIRPRIVIPSHYDMMVNNVGSPEMFRVALERAAASAVFHQMSYYEPCIFYKSAVPSLSETER